MDFITIITIITAVLTALAPYWKSIVEWIQDFVKELAPIFKDFLEGVKVFVKCVHGVFTQIAKYYYKKAEKWNIQVDEKKVENVQDIPASVKKKVEKALGEAVDISHELKNVL